MNSLREDYHIVLHRFASFCIVLDPQVQRDALLEEVDRTLDPFAPVVQAWGVLLDLSTHLVVTVTQRRCKVVLTVPNLSNRSEIASV